MHLDALAAYIDPGSGSLIIQAVIATIVAIPFFFRQQIGRVVRTLRRDGPADETATPIPPTTPTPVDGTLDLMAGRGKRTATPLGARR